MLSVFKDALVAALREWLETLPGDSYSPLFSDMETALGRYRGVVDGWPYASLSVFVQQDGLVVYVAWGRFWLDGYWKYAWSHEDYLFLADSGFWSKLSEWGEFYSRCREYDRV